MFTASSFISHDLVSPCPGLPREERVEAKNEDEYNLFISPWKILPRFDLLP